MRWKTLATATSVAVAVALMLAASATAAPAVDSRQAVQAKPTCDLGRWKHDIYKQKNLFWPIYTPTDSTDCLLRRGDYNNWGVVALQNTLIKCYAQNIARDGDFGGNTRQALLNAQAWEHYGYGQGKPGIDGVYGPETWYYLMWPHYSGSDLDGGFVCDYLGVVS